MDHAISPACVLQCSQYHVCVDEHLPSSISRVCGRTPAKFLFPFRIYVLLLLFIYVWTLMHVTSFQLTVACIKMNRLEVAAKAVEIAERRISRDRWPEYYDTKKGRLVGKQARLHQTWSIAGLLVAKLLLRNPEAAKMLTCEEDAELVSAFYCMLDTNPKRKRGRRKATKSYIV